MRINIPPCDKTTKLIPLHWKLSIMVGNVEINGNLQSHDFKTSLPRTKLHVRLPISDTTLDIFSMNIPQFLKNTFNWRPRFPAETVALPCRD